MRRLTIVSGGQAGVDRAALSAAVELGLAYDGWTPRGGWAEDLPEPPGVRGIFPNLREAPSADPAVRTRLNVRDSDATLILSSGASSAGTELTGREALRLGRPLLVSDPHGGIGPALTWLSGLKEAERLNIGGPRESECPGIAAASHGFLLALLRAA